MQAIHPKYKVTLHTSQCICVPAISGTRWRIAMRPEIGQYYSPADLTITHCQITIDQYSGLNDVHTLCTVSQLVARALGVSSVACTHCMQTHCTRTTRKEKPHDSRSTFGGHNTQRIPCSATIGSHFRFGFFASTTLPLEAIVSRRLQRYVSRGKPRVACALHFS